MKVRIARNLGIGGIFHKAGDIVEVNKMLGLELIGGGRAELIDGEAEQQKQITGTESIQEPKEQSFGKAKKK